MSCKQNRLPLLIALCWISCGCGRTPHPAAGEFAPLGTAPANRYPVRIDPLVLTVPTGTPARYPSPGTSPVLSLQLGARSLDAELAEQLRPALGKTILDPQKSLTDHHRDDMGRLLDVFFGSPSQPSVSLPSGKRAEALALYEFDSGKGAFANLRKILSRYDEWREAIATSAELNLTPEALARGSTLYRRWCLHCHGPTGGGDGSQAVQFGAMPRDYRQGLFKYGSSFPTSDQPRKGEKGKLLKGDIKQIIHNGLDGSMMPPFAHLTEFELDDLAGYVIHLSIRGEVEFEAMASVIRLLTNPNEDDPEYSVEYLEQTLDRLTILVVGNWGRANRSPIPIPPDACDTETQRWESAVRGYKAFAARGCFGCHDDYGRVQQLKYDAWGTVVRPRDLTLGVFRGGRRAENLYARVYGGIVPSTMPDYTANLKQNPPTPGRPDEVWDVVHFLQVLADPAGRRVLDLKLRTEKERDPNLTIIPFD